MLNTLKENLLKLIETDKKFISNLKRINIIKNAKWKARKEAFEYVVEQIELYQKCEKMYPETCEWLYNGNLFDTSPHLGVSHMRLHDDIYTYKYCPYCGKKIVVINYRSKHEET